MISFAVGLDYQKIPKAFPLEKENIFIPGSVHFVSFYKQQWLCPAATKHENTFRKIRKI
jgi:hypothetical protein